MVAKPVWLTGKTSLPTVDVPMTVVTVGEIVTIPAFINPEKISVEKLYFC